MYRETNKGQLIEIAGKKGSGKTQLNFSICAINSINNKKTIYLDGSGSFRPERIKSIIDRNLIEGEDSKPYLKNISYQRIYDLDDLEKIIKKIKIMDFDFVIIDDIIPMFMYRFKDSGRVEIRRFVRDLSLITLSKKITIIFTNIIFEKNSHEKNIYQSELFFYDIIRYVHFKFHLKSDLKNKRITECKLIQPIIKNEASSYIYFDRL
jgi:RecA/RadA recombinase